MGTRGFVGIVVDGVEKIAYNHWDSNPSAKGAEFLTWLSGQVDNLDGHLALHDAARRLRVVEPGSVPTAAEIKELERFANTNVDTPTGKLDSWYKLLRETQGLLPAMLEAGVIEDASEFPGDSAFCEWGYLIDLDLDYFEVYKGGQSRRHKNGRFAHRVTTDANGFPAALVARWFFLDLPAPATHAEMIGLECGD